MRRTFVVLKAFAVFRRIGPDRARTGTIILKHDDNINTDFAFLANQIATRQ